MVFTEASTPTWKMRPDLIADFGAALKFDRVPLAVVEADRFNLAKSAPAPKPGTLLNPAPPKKEPRRHRN
jgi:hypothetical protein